MLKLKLQYFGHLMRRVAVKTRVTIRPPSQFSEGTRRRADSVTHRQVTALNSLQQLDKKRIYRKGDSRRSAPAGAGGERGAQTGESEALEVFHSGQGPLRGSASPGFGPPEGRPQSTLQPKPDAARGKKHAARTRLWGRGVHSARRGRFTALPEPCSDSPSAPASGFRAG